MNPNKTKQKYINKQISELTSRDDATYNPEHGLVFKPSLKLGLYLDSASWFVDESKFYGDNTLKIIQKARQLIDEDAEYVLKLASYLRNEMNMRTGPVILLTEVALNTTIHGLVRKYAKEILRRPDDILSCLSYIAYSYGGDIGSQNIDECPTPHSIPSSLKKGINDVFQTFTEYQLSKYKSKNKDMNLSDAIKLCHPKPLNSDMSKIYKDIIENNISPPDTWEVIISKEGSNKQAWEKVVPKLPYMATLRNIRNLLIHRVNNLDIALTKISNPSNIKNSKQFPYRYYSAYKTINNISDLGINKTKTLESLRSAINMSLEYNVPHIGGRAAIFADNSASMLSGVSKHSDITHSNIANLHMLTLDYMFTDTILGVYGEYLELVESKRQKEIRLDMVGNMPFVGPGYTNAFRIFDKLLKSKTIVDYVVNLSDMVIYDNRKTTYSTKYIKSYLKYKKFNPDFTLVNIDLTGYGNLSYPEDTKNVVNIGGFSNNIYTLLYHILRRDDPVQYINEYI